MASHVGAGRRPGGSEDEANNHKNGKRTSHIKNNNSTKNNNPKNHEDATTYLTYEDIIRGKTNEPTTSSSSRASTARIQQSPTSTKPDETVAKDALSSRLASFRNWLSKDAGVWVHSAICIVNGEATDGTKNAPVMILDKKQPPPPSINQQQDVAPRESATGLTASTSSAAGRVGAIDGGGEQALYDRTMGCQVRVVRDVAEGQVILTMPRHAMVTPDLVAASDAGRAILACIKTPLQNNGENNTGEPIMGFWDAFENTTILESAYSQKLSRSTGPQLVTNILQERERAKGLLKLYAHEREKSIKEGVKSKSYSLVEANAVSTRAPLLAFLIHQRFSPTLQPLVVDLSMDIIDPQFELDKGMSDNALSNLLPISKPPGCPETFGPYARTLPSFISIPLCWSKAELEMLASSIPGFPILQQVAATTFQLAAEFTSLLKAGILQRFPELFSEGLLTWDRWVWAAAIVASRALPATCYIDAGLKDASEFKPEDPLEFQSPAHLWNELGVMVPLLDMLNHEIEAHQVTWQPCKPNSVRIEGGNGIAEASENVPDGSEPSKGHPPRAIVHKKVKKDSELFCCYAASANQQLILQYGFAQMANPADEVRIGWALMDAVGHLEPPTDYTSLVDDEAVRKFLIFETTRQEDIDKWWTPDRLKLLEKEAFSGSEEGFMSKLESGKKFTALAYADGSYHPILLAAFVVATMPKIELQKHVLSKHNTITLSKRHQQVLRCYLSLFFSRKLEKLLQNIHGGLKGRLGTEKIWTSASKGGLNYIGTEDDSIGWRSFFDVHAYGAAMAVEKHFYAMGTLSCILSLYDGHLRALQLSLDGVCSEEKFTENVLHSLTELGFGIAEEKEDATKNAAASPERKSSTKNKRRSKQQSQQQQQRNVTVTASAASTTSGSEKPPALKLHVGNLSFTTTPSDMYDYFSSLYGKDNILECHIPVERETGRSRGFGFVTMPESVANRVLESGRKHELGGRFVKVARSNSAGTSSSGRAQPGGMAISDRCTNCGYRPKYCTCGIGPPIFVNGGPPPPPLPRREPSPRSRGLSNYHYHPDFYARNGDIRAWHGAPPVDFYHDREDSRYYDRYGRDFDRTRYEGPYDAGRSRSYDRDDNRNYDRGPNRKRSPSVDSRGSSRRWASDDVRGSSRREDSWDHDRKRSRSDSREKSRRKKCTKRRTRSRSRSSSFPK